MKKVVDMQLKQTEKEQKTILDLLNKTNILIKEIKTFKIQKNRSNFLSYKELLLFLILFNIHNNTFTFEYH